MTIKYFLTKRLQYDKLNIDMFKSCIQYQSDIDYKNEYLFDELYEIRPIKYNTRFVYIPWFIDISSIEDLIEVDKCHGTKYNIVYFILPNRYYKKLIKKAIISTEYVMEKNIIYQLRIIPDDILDTYKDNLDWSSLLCTTYFNKYSIKLFDNYIDWDFVSLNCHLNDNTIIEIVDKIDWKLFMKSRMFDDCIFDIDTCILELSNGTTIDLYRFEWMFSWLFTT